MAAADIVVSAIRLAEIEAARGVFSHIGITLPELNVKIEEADVRMIPHALHSVNGGASKVILLSNDTYRCCGSWTSLLESLERPWP